MPRGMNPRDRLTNKMEAAYLSGNEAKFNKLADSSIKEADLVTRSTAGDKSKKLKARVEVESTASKNFKLLTGKAKRKPTFKEAVNDPSIRKSKNVVRHGDREAIAALGKELRRIDIAMKKRPMPRPKKDK